MAGGGSELETFLLEDELDVGRWRQAAIAFEKHVDDDEEADSTDREKVSEIEEIASSDLAAHVYSWFYGDLSVAFIMNASTTTNEREKQWGAKAMKRLVYWSTSKVLRDVVGDSLTDAMRPIYWSRRLLIEFGQAGGLGALFGDWVCVYPRISIATQNVIGREYMPKSLREYSENAARRLLGEPNQKVTQGHHATNPRKD